MCRKCAFARSLSLAPGAYISDICRECRDDAGPPCHLVEATPTAVLHLPLYDSLRRFPSGSKLKCRTTLAAAMPIPPIPQTWARMSCHGTYKRSMIYQPAPDIMRGPLHCLRLFATGLAGTLAQHISDTHAQTSEVNRSCELKAGILRPGPFARYLSWKAMGWSPAPQLPSESVHRR